MRGVISGFTAAISIDRACDNISMSFAGNEPRGFIPCEVSRRRVFQVEIMEH